MLEWRACSDSGDFLLCVNMFGFHLSGCSECGWVLVVSSHRTNKTRSHAGHTAVLGYIGKTFNAFTHVASCVGWRRHCSDEGNGDLTRFRQIN